MLRYDTRCYFNVRSNADMSQLNLPTEITTTKCKTEKLKGKNGRSGATVKVWGIMEPWPNFMAAAGQGGVLRS